MLSDATSQASEPIMTAPDRRAEELHQLQSYLQRSQTDRVALNIGGQRFETNKTTLMQDPASLFALLFQEDNPIRPLGTSYFFDRDPAHFRYIINYLWNGCQLEQAILPREQRYLLELKHECTFYRISGLQRIVERRIEQIAAVGFER